jgi:4-oxalocrotonate tautomerase
MPIVKVNWLSGRTVEQKARIAAAITKSIVEVGGSKPEDVIVLFIDMPSTDIAKSGRLLSE